MFYDVRKIQKSKTGFYINIPKFLTDKFNLQGGEIATIEAFEDQDRKWFVIELVNIER